jgi:hypothetical protein
MTSSTSNATTVRSKGEEESTFEEKTSPGRLSRLPSFFAPSAKLQATDFVVYVQTLLQHRHTVCDTGCDCSPKARRVGESNSHVFRDGVGGVVGGEKGDYYHLPVSYLQFSRKWMSILAFDSNQNKRASGHRLCSQSWIFDGLRLASCRFPGRSGHCTYTRGPSPCLGDQKLCCGEGNWKVA